MPDLDLNLGKSTVGNIKKWENPAGWQSESAESKVVVELELKSPQYIKTLIIGNKGAAFIEVFAGHDGLTSDKYQVTPSPFLLRQTIARFLVHLQLSSVQVLLPITPLMSLTDSKTNANTDRVFEFTTDNLLRKTTAERKWPRLRVTNPLLSY